MTGSSIFRRNLLSDRVVLVTGGGSGIGRGIALRFAQHGAKLALLGRTASKLESVAEEARGYGTEAAVFALDVRDYEAVERAVAGAVDAFGRLDTVVCSAAGNFLSPAASLSSNGFKAVIDIDLVGTFNTCRAAFQQLAVRGGSVLSITATQAWIPTPLQCHAGAAKAGIAKLTQDLALEWGKSKVRVNAIAPGPIDDTEGMRRLAPTDSGAREKLTEKMPVGRFGTIDEIADVAVFLSSDAAGFITGTTVVADGGQALLGATGFTELMA